MIYSEWHWTLDSLCNFLQCEWVSPILQTVVVQEVGSHTKIIDRLIVSTQLAPNALPQQGYFYISKKKTSLWRKHQLEPSTLISLWNLWAISVFKGRGHLRIVPYIQDLWYWWLYDEKGVFLKPTIPLKESNHSLDDKTICSGKYTVLEEKTKEYSTRMQLHIKDFQVNFCMHFVFTYLANLNKRNDLFQGVGRRGVHLHIYKLFGQIRRHHSTVSISSLYAW